MAIVERLLPRHWDGRRLLQFLTGLALLALAFAVPAGVVASPAQPAPVTSVVSTAVDAAAATQADREQVTTTVAAPLTGPDGDAFAPAAAPVEPAALTGRESQRAWGVRGPPRA